jgi:CRP-like cAMP-binding protein
MNNFSQDCFTCKSKNCSILKNCDTFSIAEINSKKICKDIKKDKSLFYEGDDIKGVYFIKKGLLKIELNGKIGRPLILNIAGAGSVFGHRYTSINSSHTQTVTALENTEFCYIPIHLFQDVLLKSNSLKEQLSHIILKELEQTEKGIVFLAHRSVKEKVAKALLVFADFYNYQQNKSFKIHFGRDEIADFTCTTKEQVSKTIHEFIKSKLIKCKAKTFYYLNITELKKIADHTL